jgi:hypothetical protein
MGNEEERTAEPFLLIFVLILKVCLYEGLGGPPEYLCTEGFSRINSVNFDVEITAIRTT